MDNYYLRGFFGGHFVVQQAFEVDCGFGLDMDYHFGFASNQFTFGFVFSDFFFVTVLAKLFIDSHCLC